MSSFNLLREITPEKLRLSIDELMEEANTPTFNSHHTELTEVDFPFLDDKENIDNNRKVLPAGAPDHLTKPLKMQEDTYIGEKQRVHQNNDRIQQLRQLHELKSRGSTSPESNGRPKNEQTSSQISKVVKNQTPDSQFRVSKRKRSSHLEESKSNSEEEGVCTPKKNKREGKASHKKQVSLRKLDSATSDKQAKGCTCKKSQCKKLY